MSRILLNLLFSALMLPLLAVAADTEITLQCEGRGAISGYQRLIRIGDIPPPVP